MVDARPFAERRRRRALGSGRRGAPPRRRVVLGHLSEGFRIPDEHLVVVTEADIFGEARQRRRTRRVVGRAAAARTSAS